MEKLKQTLVPNNGSILIVSGSPAGMDSTFLTSLAKKAQLIVAVDSGANALHTGRVIPDVLIGDFDSIDPEVLVDFKREYTDVIAFNPHKDATDLELALDYVRELLKFSGFNKVDCPEVVITNCLGGRIDHELAVLGTIARNSDLVPVIREMETTVYFLNSQGSPKLVFGPDDKGRTVSVMALRSHARVTLVGLRWELDSYELEPMSGLGVSNVVEGDGAYARVDTGTVAVFLNKKPSTFAPFASV